MAQLTEAQKYEIVFRHTINYDSIRKISLEMKINRISVTKWLNKYDKDGNFNRQSGSGNNLYRGSRRSSASIARFTINRWFFTKYFVKRTKFAELLEARTSKEVIVKKAEAFIDTYKLFKMTKTVLFTLLLK